MMFHKNLTYYRLKEHLTKKELAERAGVTPMAITHYENGDRKPEMATIKRLADVLNVRVSDFLQPRKTELVFDHREFRKNSSLTKTQENLIRESLEEYLSRFMTIAEIIGGEVIPSPPALGKLRLIDDPEICGLALRESLELPPHGPLGPLVEVLENHGILIYFLDLTQSNFSGMNGLVDTRPYLIVNRHMTPERVRSTMAHELAHLLFDWSSWTDEKEIEKMATAISGAFLFPKSDAIRELGLRRSHIGKDMELVACEYGISMILLAIRARQCEIITQQAEKEFLIKVSQLGWRKNEPSRISPEESTLFRQLVYRAVNEGEISFQKGAEFLNVSYQEIVSNCCYPGDC